MRANAFLRTRVLWSLVDIAIWALSLTLALWFRLDFSINDMCRNALSWEERLALDVDYVDTHTLRGDLSILGRTVAAVIRCDGIAAEGDVTMPEFTGTSTAGPTS